MFGILSTPQTPPHRTASHAGRNSWDAPSGPQKLPETKARNFPTPPALPPVVGGAGGVKGVSGQKSAPRVETDTEQQACVITRGTRRSFHQCATCFYGVRAQRSSHLTITLPCILAVSIRLVSFIFPPPSSRSAAERFQPEFGFGPPLSLLCLPATSQPGSHPASQSSRQRVSS